MHRRVLRIRLALFISLLSPLAIVRPAQAQGVDPAVNVFPDGFSDLSPPSLSGISGGGSIELGQNVVLTVLAYSSVSAVSYQWRKNGVPITGAIAAKYAISAATPSDAGTYTVTVTNSAGSSVATTDVTVKPLAPPVITSQPYSLVLEVGQQASFLAGATGSYPRTYQWKRDGVDISGATSANYKIASITTGDAAAYSVVITNSQGSATSASASLTVNAARLPVISSGTPYDLTTTAGSSPSLSVSVNSGSNPFSYQWYNDGTALPGATSSMLSFTEIGLADAGKYSVSVSNGAGSVTSREAIVTVNPPTPISFYLQPASQTLYEGQLLNVYVSVSGSSPVTFQWQKDGSAVPGATNNYYSVPSATLADGGSYTVVVTNPAGTVTSSAAAIVVNPAVAPAITTNPRSQNLAYGAYLSLSVQATGTTPLTYQWAKDGTAIPGATSSEYSLSAATAANRGAYTVTISNRAGSVTSPAATIAVADAIPPTITTQPVSQQVAVGLSTQLSVSYSSSGTGALTVQWRKNGVAIANGTSSYYNLSSVKADDAGDYTVVITGPGGSITSNVAKLTVLPALAPSVSYWPSGPTAALGQSANFGVSSVQGSPPLAYQWYKDGTAIAGATRAYYDIPSVAASDLGTYVLQISNDGGVIASPGMRLRLYPTSATPWVAVAPYGDVVYFLATTPGRIERYDLRTETWLPTVRLSDTLVPTAFAPTAEGVYIAYGRSLARRPLDLGTETPLLNAANDITQIFAYDDWLYYLTASDSYGGNTALLSLRRSTLQAGPNVTAFRNLAFSTRNRRAYGSNASSYTSSKPTPVDVGTDGSLTVVANSGSYDYYQLPNGPRVFLVGDEEYFTTTGGSLFRTSDFSFAGALGEPFTDLTSLADGSVVVVRDNVAQALRPGDFFETGQAKLPFTALRLFARGTDVFAFGAAGAGTTAYSVTKLASTAFSAPAPVAVATVPGERFSVDDIFFGDGVVHCLSRSKQAVLRWSTKSQRYLAAVPLRGLPRISSQTPGAARALLAYEDGVITALPLSSGTAAEAQIATTGNRVWAATDLGDRAMLNVYDYGDSGDFRIVFGPNGRAVSVSSWSYWGGGLGWNPTLRRLYSRGRFTSDAGIAFETIPTTGILPLTQDKTVSGLTPPLRPNADGSLMATGNGRVVNADLAATGTLANNVLDAAWLSGGLYTMRAGAGGAEIQQWAKGTYLLAGQVTVPGTPQRMFTVSDTQLLVVTTVQGFVTFTFVNADLSLVTVGSPGAFAGFYLAKLGGGAGAGDLALLVRSNGTAVLVANLTGTRAGLVCENVTLGGDGVFIAPARDLADGAARTLSGAIAADGTFSGTIGTLNLPFAGTRVTGSAVTAGFYRADAVNGGSGAAYVVVAPDGRGIVVAQNPLAVDGGTGTVDATGTLPVTLSTGAKFTVSLNPGSGSLTATADKGAFLTTTYGGLRDGVARTDRLANISTRGRTGVGEDALIAGFVVTGTSSRPVLVRAIGPALTNYGVVGVVADPKLTLFRGGTQVVTSDNWSSEPGAQGIAATAARLGAFALPSPGRDAAFCITLDPGAYTAQVTAPTGDTGVSLIEVYDAGDSANGDATRLVNISTRGRVGVGEDVLIAGIVVSGNAPKRLLVRGVGPTLGTFGVAGVLADPVLTILSGNKTLLSNDDWTTQTGGWNAGDVATAGGAVGAFTLADSSKDAALLITLPPGSYTAQLSGKGTTTGVALIEVYELP